MFWRPPRSEDPFVGAFKCPVECYFDNDPPDSNATTALLHDMSLLQIGGFYFPAQSCFYSLMLVPAMSDGLYRRVGMAEAPIARDFAHVGPGTSR